jgi:hypothetical protein
MTRSLRRFTVFALLGVLLPVQAFAQSDTDRATARELGLDGETALGAKDWKRAEDDFHRADALFHAPTLSLGLARAQAAQGKFVEAWENYHRVVLENVTSTPGFAKALADATSEIGAIEGRRSRVTVNVTGADAPKVTIDDVPVRVEALGVVRFIDPGTHLVKAVADGYLPATQSMTIAEGGAQTVSLALQKDPNATTGAAPLNTPPPVAVAPLPGGVEQPTGSSGSSSVGKTLGFVALGVGGVGLIEGIITGVLAMGKHSTLTKDGCANGTCPTSADSDLSSYHTLGALSTTGFIVGGVGLAGGLVLVLTAPKSSPAPSPAAGLSVTPYIGLGTAGATGTF